MNIAKKSELTIPNENKKENKMLIPAVIMAILSIVLLIIGYSKGENQHILGLKSAMSMMLEVLPLLVFAFITAGMIQILIPHELISGWIGTKSGLRGLLIGSMAGCLTPGGPFVTFPIAAGLLRTGAGTGPIVAYVTSWSLFAIIRLSMEIGMIGWRFTTIRIVSTFIFPPIAGFIASILFSVKI